ncbi:Immunoglobulin-binding protein 1 [Geodia barretti]|uniref:Immunoglobulin-binding protein 1 n=1 Tax=Geodia barretti TaxID=519541 RepID=A0AA35XG25_GEOBA|nr:Immunoglobulin-binding protein 1 [Geodia barretti]
MSGEENAPALSQLFLRGWEARRKLDACELTTGSPEHSVCVAEGTSALERATELASHASLFSDNEDLDEVPTSSLKYLLLPELLGEMTLQQTEGERMDTVLKARVYFIDYLRRCRSYGVTKEDPPPLTPLSPPPSVGGASSEQPQGKTYNQLVAERVEKIQRLREKKELERRTEELSTALNEGSGGREEEGGREQWVAVLQLNLYRSREFVKSIDDEIQILRHIEAVRKGEGPPVAKRPGASGHGPPRQPEKPLVITREMLRGEVFGAGYPSLPTMTVEEFYEQRYGGGAGGGGGRGESAGRERWARKGRRGGGGRGGRG